MSRWPDRTVADRFWAKVDCRGQDECWPWLGYRLPKGYGILRIVGNKRMVATRVSLALAGRPRPSDQHEACHSCDNPPCVNPAHLWWGTRHDNMRDSVKKGHHAQASRTHCFRGHALTGDNIMLNNLGRRLCRQCNRIRGRWQRERRRQLPEDAARVNDAAAAKGKAIQETLADARAREASNA